MGSQIEDGRGSGRKAEVDSEHRLAVFATTLEQQHFINQNDERYWMFPFDAVDPTGADDYFVYILYSGTGELHITDVRLTSTVAGFMEPQVVTGTAAGGTAVGLVNRNLGSSKVPDGTYEFGVDITGLTDAGHLHHMWLQANVEGHLGLNGHYIIQPGQAMALLWTAATGILSGTVSMYEKLK